jgi:hypothetical protein
VGRNYEIRTPMCSPIYQYLQGFSENLQENNQKNPSMWNWTELIRTNDVDIIALNSYLKSAYEWLEKESLL